MKLEKNRVTNIYRNWGKLNDAEAGCNVNDFRMTVYRLY